MQKFKCESEYQNKCFSVRDEKSFYSEDKMFLK